MTTVRGGIECVTALAAAAGVRVRLHAQQIDSGLEFGIDADDPVVAASVAKVPIAIELARQAASGRLDLAASVRVDPTEQAPSPNGLGTFRFPARVSMNDLAVLMLSVSDNVAADILLGTIGKPAVRELLATQGLTATAVIQSCQEIIASIGEDLDLDYRDDEAALAGIDRAHLAALRALDTAQTNRTTAREMTLLLRAVWRDEIAPARACAMVREWMSHQAWGERLRSGFPDDRISVVSKTGTLPGLRNEIGVVTYPDGDRYAVAVFTRDDDFRARVPERDAFIGTAARAAIDQLRDSCTL